MSGGNAADPGLGRARWTHLALRVADIERSISWYERLTPMRVLKRFTDDYGVGVWLADPDEPAPFVLVLSQFAAATDPFGYAPAAVLGPYAHIGFELESREAVDAIGAMAEKEGILTYPPTQMPSPIGYICFTEDPDGNTIEFSYGQGTYEIWNDVWGGSK